MNFDRRIKGLEVRLLPARNSNDSVIEKEQELAILADPDFTPIGQELLECWVEDLDKGVDVRMDPHFCNVFGKFTKIIGAYPHAWEVLLREPKTRSLALDVLGVFEDQDEMRTVRAEDPAYR